MFIVIHTENCPIFTNVVSSCVCEASGSGSGTGTCFCAGGTGTDFCSSCGVWWSGSGSAYYSVALDWNWASAFAGTCAAWEIGTESAIQTRSGSFAAFSSGLLAPSPSHYVGRPRRPRWCRTDCGCAHAGAAGLARPAPPSHAAPSFDGSAQPVRISSSQPSLCPAPPPTRPRYQGTQTDLRYLNSHT